jgi:phage shock protein E
MKRLMLLLVVMGLVSGCTTTKLKISADELPDLLDAGAVLIDVRTPEEYASGYIPQAVNLPLDQLGTITYPKDQVIIVYCRSGRRSQEAQRVLLEKGYETVYDLGGILDYPGELTK